MTYPLVDHLRQLADAQHEGSELEVTLRQAADEIEKLDGVILDMALGPDYYKPEREVG